MEPQDLLPALREATGYVYLGNGTGRSIAAGVIASAAVGCPVIASRVSALPEVVGQAGLLIDPGDVEGLSQAMLRLAREPGLRERLREAGLARARRFSWEESARKTLGVFEAVTGNA
jgi:glycosyltransferase involved in cell wall biosynthesis